MPGRAEAHGAAGHIRWAAFAYGVALALTLVMGVFLLRIPIQLSDSFTEFTVVDTGSVWDVVRAEFQGGPYMRPFRRGLIKLVFDASGGRYTAWFRGFQVAQLAVLLLLTVRGLRVRTREAALVVPLALAMVVGGHTFAGAILEGLPINHFLTILVCCAAALNLVRARPSWLVDVAAVVLTLFAMLTIESGLVLAAIFVMAWVVGFRGVSGRAVGLVTLCVAAYVLGRFVLLSGTTPGLDERSAGFGFRVLSTDELVRRFGNNPLPFYLYNLASAVLSVLFAEPRGGVFAFTDGLVHGRMEPWRLASVLTSTATTGMLVWYAARRAGAWRHWQFTDADRLLLVASGVLLGNAVFAYAYEKDAILGPAGYFHALAGAAVLGEIVAGRPGLGLPHAVAVALTLVVAGGWTSRLVGVHYSLEVRDLTVRTEWAYYDDWERKQQFQTPFTPLEQQIRQALRRQAIRGASGARRLAGPFPNPLFDVTQ